MSKAWDWNKQIELERACVVPRGDLGDRAFRGYPQRKRELCAAAALRRACARRARLVIHIHDRDATVLLSPKEPRPWPSRQERKARARHERQMQALHAQAALMRESAALDAAWEQALADAAAPEAKPSVRKRALAIGESIHKTVAGALGRARGRKTVKDNAPAEQPVEAQVEAPAAAAEAPVAAAEAPPKPKRVRKPKPPTTGG